MLHCFLIAKTNDMMATEFKLPTPRTRASAKKATLMRVLKEVLELDDDDLLVKAIEDQGLRSIDDLLCLLSLIHI